jgi:hypothetical protein
MDKISIELPAQAWNAILNALGQRPYAEVVELIAEVKRQGEAAIKTLNEASVDQGHA